MRLVICMINLRRYSMHQVHLWSSSTSIYTAWNNSTFEPQSCVIFLHLKFTRSIAFEVTILQYTKTVAMFQRLRTYQLIHRSKCSTFWSERIELIALILRYFDCRWTFSLVVAPSCWLVDQCWFIPPDICQHCRPGSAINPWRSIALFSSVLSATSFHDVIVATHRLSDKCSASLCLQTLCWPYEHIYSPRIVYCWKV